MNVDLGNLTITELCSSFFIVFSVCAILFKFINVCLSKLAILFNEFRDEHRKDVLISQRQVLKEIYKDVQSKGYITDSDSEIFDEAFERYEANGGNGYIHNTVSPYISKMKLEHIYTNDNVAKEHYKKYGNY